MIMTANEFLEGLRKALGNDLGGPVIQENVEYYRGYIREEVEHGRSEEEVVAELGDPWVIAQTIIDSVEEGGYQTEEGYVPESSSSRRSSEEGARVYTFGFDTWWKKLLLILGIVGIIMVVVTVIGGIISVLSPLLIPFVIYLVISRSKRRRE